jgi:hypothetical protein
MSSSMYKEELNAGDSTRYNLGIDTVVKYTKDAENGGINITIDSTPPN